MRLLSIKRLWAHLVVYFVVLAFAEGALAQLARIGADDLEDAFYKPQGQVRQVKSPKAKNQGAAEECFLFAYTTEVETYLINQGQEAPSLSVTYLLAKKLQFYVEQTLEYGESSASLRGGQIYDAIGVAHLYGVVPEVSWRPKVSYKNWPTGELYETIEKKLRSWRAKLERTGDDEGKSSAAYKKLLKEAKADTLQPLWKLTGDLPAKFNYQGKEYSPKQLSRSLGLERRNDIYMLFPGPKWGKPELDYFAEQLDWITDITKGSYELAESEWDNTLEQIRINVDSGIATLIGTSWGRGGGHVMTIVGYEQRDGEITHLKAINSWGTDWGKKGAAWFEAKDVSKKYDQIWWFN